jgi:hypothetical protein
MTSAAVPPASAFLDPVVRNLFKPNRASGIHCELITCRCGTEAIRYGRNP